MIIYNIMTSRIIFIIIAFKWAFFLRLIRILNDGYKDK